LPSSLPSFVRYLYPPVFLVGTLLAWFAVSEWWQWISPTRFPTPTQTAEAFQRILIQGYGNGRLHQHIVQSVLLVSLSFTISAALGIALGIFMGASRKIEALVNPIFLTLRPIPPLAWIPLAIVWLGLENSAKVMVIFVAAFVPSVINTFTGIRSLEVPQREAARMLGIRGRAYYFEVLIPAAMPMIFTGMRLSLQASWTTLVASELVGAVLGLGSILNQAAQDINPPMILVGMIFVALSGWLMTYGLGLLERLAIPWRPV
jgi:taurine transport system permease protein